MKHKKISLTLTILVSLVFLSFLSPTLAWFNGPDGASGNRKKCAAYAIPRDPVEVYKEHFHKINDPYMHFYSTHDFIAHHAIRYLNLFDPLGKYAWLYDQSKRYFYIYLLATEYPDYQQISPKITLDCGKSTQVSNDFKHQSHKLNLCLSYARRYKSRVLEALYKLDSEWNPDPWYETAAFYLGAITHYIAEVAHPTHASGKETGMFHPWLEKEVSKVTTLEDFYNPTFFTIDLQTILGWSPILDGFKSISPKKAISNLALITTLNNESYFGNQNNGEQDVLYFLHFFSQDCGNGRGSGQFKFDETGRGGMLLPPEELHLSGNYKAFFDRIEVLLNYAVYFTACTIKNILMNFNGQFISCKNEDDDDKKPQPTDSERSPPFDSLDLLVRFGAIIAAFVAVGVVSRKTLGGFR
jgi:hypothetical protein